MTQAKKYSAEFIGTFVLVFMGCGSAIYLGTSPEGGHLAIALAFGLSVVAMAYVIGNISGCHINPAISLAMLIRKKITIVDFCGYNVAQAGGAIAAAGLLKYLLSIGLLADKTGGLGSNGIAQAGGIWPALVFEDILTFIFVLVVLGVTSEEKKGNVAGIVIGLTLTFVHIVGIPLTGTSVNPARSLGPAIFAGGLSLSHVWVFVVGPFAGAALAAFVYPLIKLKEKAPSMADSAKRPAKKRKK